MWSFFEDRADRETERRQQEGGGRDSTGGLGANGHETPARDGLALEGAGYLSIYGVAGPVLAVLIGHGPNNIE